MGLFNNLMSKIFGHASAATAQASTTATGAAPVTQSSGSAGSVAQTGSAAPANVDVDAVLKELASKNSEDLDYKRSIVDLLKLVGMDSSLASRKELAKELGYSGDTGDSASMNIWLHKQVLRKLSENGGKVPKELLD